MGGGGRPLPLTLALPPHNFLTLAHLPHTFHPSGHIHYDMLFDVPHNDKFNRAWNGTFEIVAGP